MPRTLDDIAEEITGFAEMDTNTHLILSLMKPSKHNLDRLFRLRAQPGNSKALCGHIDGDI